MKIHKFSGRKLRRVKPREDPFKYVLLENLRFGNLRNFGNTHNCKCNLIYDSYYPLRDLASLHNHIFSNENTLDDILPLRNYISRDETFKRTYLCSLPEKKIIDFMFKYSQPKPTGSKNIIYFETAMNNQKIEFLTPTEERLTTENKYLKIRIKNLEDAVSYLKSTANESREGTCSRKYCNSRRF